jgi:hypothetical protein
MFARIREDLYTFDNAGMIDEGRFYKQVVYIINLLGINWYIDAEEIIDVCNYTADLPDDFKLLEVAFKCSKSVEQENADGVLLKRRVFDYYPEIANPSTHSYVCKDCPDFWKLPPTCQFNRQEEILVPRGSTILRYSSPLLLKLGNVDTKKCCVTNCTNMFSRATDEITITNNRVFTNFKDGSIYLMYNAFPLDEETHLPLIPDDPIIEKCIEDYIKYNLMKNMVTNGDGDVSRLLQLYRDDYKESLSQAIYLTKLPTFKSMTDMIRRNKKSLNLYQL